MSSRQRRDLRAKNAALRPVVSSKDAASMNRTSSGIAGVLDNLKGRLAVLERGKNTRHRFVRLIVWMLNAEIKADEKGKKDYDDQLARLARKKAEIQKRLAMNETWAQNFDRDIGPFESKLLSMFYNLHY